MTDLSSSSRREDMSVIVAGGRVVSTGRCVSMIEFVRYPMIEDSEVAAEFEVRKFTA